MVSAMKIIIAVNTSQLDLGGRVAAAEVRREALAGLPPERQDVFVDILLTIKANLSQPAENGNGANGSRKRKR